MGFSQDSLRIDAEKEIERICARVRETLGHTLKRRGAVVGLSGGIDSSVVAALCVKALGKERVLGVFMPERDSSDDALRLGRMLASHLGIEAVVEDIAPALQGLGCYARQNEAIRQVFPQYGEGWKCKITLPSILESDRLNVFQLTVQSPDGTTETSRMSQAVVSRVRSEREASWPVQIARAFEDLHLVWAGLGAMSATASCVATIGALLYFAPAQRDDSLSGVLAALAQPGSNRNPLSLDERMELPRFEGENVEALEALPKMTTPHPTALAVAGVLTQEGIVAQASFLPANEDDELERSVMRAVSATRFRPAQHNGSPVAVNMIWLFEQTTVKGKIGKI